MNNFKAVRPWTLSVAGSILFWLSACSKGAEVTESQGSQTQLIKLVVGSKAKVRLEEVSRDARTSTFRVTSDSTGSPTMDTFLLVDACGKLAEARGAKYFINLKEWHESDGSEMYVNGYADTDDVNIHEYFGNEYTLVNEYGQPRGFLSVADWKRARKEGPLRSPEEK